MPNRVRSGRLMGSIVLAVAVLGAAGAALRAGFSSAGPEWAPGRSIPTSSRLDLCSARAIFWGACWPPAPP